MMRLIDFALQSAALVVGLPMLLACVCLGPSGMMREYILWEIDCRTRDSRTWLGPAGASDFHRWSLPDRSEDLSHLGGCRFPHPARKLPENWQCAQKSGNLGLQVIHNKHILKPIGTVLPKGFKPSSATLGQ